MFATSNPNQYSACETLPPREHAERFKSCDDIGANERNDERSGAGKNARESE